MPQTLNIKMKIVQDKRINKENYIKKV